MRGQREDKNQIVVVYKSTNQEGTVLNAEKICGAFGLLFEETLRTNWKRLKNNKKI